MSLEAKKRNERIFQEAGRELRVQGQDLTEYGMLSGRYKALRSHLLRGGTLAYIRPGIKSPKTLRNVKFRLGMPGGTRGKARPPAAVCDHFSEALASLPASKEDLSKGGGWKIGIEKKEMKLSNITWR